MKRRAGKKEALAKSRQLPDAGLDQGTNFEYTQKYTAQHQPAPVMHERHAKFHWTPSENDEG